MRHGSLFSGIGGFDLAAQWMGWENVFQVEIDPFCQKVLAKNFPTVERYGDIKQFDGSLYRGAVDIISGGFPCQPYSLAGKRKGKNDARHLWPEMLRVIREVKPSFVVGENVSGLLNWSRGLVFEEVHADLEAEGYEAQAVLLPAAGVGAWHRRERVWFIAYSNNLLHKGELDTGRNQPETNGSKGSNRGKGQTPFRERFRTEPTTSGSSAADSNSAGFQERQINAGVESIAIEGNERQIFTLRDEWIAEPAICGKDHGIPNRVDRIKGLGNAIVPQVAFEIFKAIETVSL